MQFIKLKRFRIWEVTFFSFIVLLTMILGSCENEISKIKTVTSTEDLPAITAEGFEMLVSDSSVIRSKMQTPLLIKHDNEKDPYIEFPKGVKIVEYDVKMNVISSITAQYAKNFTGEDRWEAKNNVIAVNPKGDTLKNRISGVGH